MFSQEQEDNVRTSAPSLSRAIFHALFGLPFIGGGLMVGVVPFISGESFMSVILGIPFLGAGGWIWWTAYKAFRRWNAYGTSHLRLASAPVPLGESLRARLRAPVSADEQPPNGFQVRVASTLGSGDDEDTVWEDWTSVRGQPGAAETEVPLSIDLPVSPLPDHRRRMADATPWGSEMDTLEKMDWTMEVTASFDDKPDYEASFDLPVTVPHDLDERAADASSTDGSISSAESAEQEAEPAPADASDEDEVYWGMDDGEDANLRRAGSEDKSSAGSEEAFSEPVSAGIRMDEHPGEGLTFSFDHARPPMRSTGYFLAGVGTLFTGIGAPTLYMALLNGGTGLILFGSLSVLGGGLALRKAWTTLTHASSIQVANGQVEVQKHPFFLESAPTRMSCDVVEDVEVQATAGSGNQSFYMLFLTRQDSDSPIPVASGLADKDEAEWIADRIREAAGQQAAST